MGIYWSVRVLVNGESHITKRDLQIYNYVFGIGLERRIQEKQKEWGEMEGDFISVGGLVMSWVVYVRIDRVVVFTGAFSSHPNFEKEEYIELYRFSGYYNKPWFVFLKL